MFALGGRFQPTFTQKCEMNGQNKHPIFTYLKNKFPYPNDDPFSLMTNPKFIIWSPVRHSDMAWDLRKLLIGWKGGALPTLQLHSPLPQHWAWYQGSPQRCHIGTSCSAHRSTPSSPWLSLLRIQCVLEGTAGPKLSLDISLRHWRALPFLSACCLFLSQISGWWFNLASKTWAGSGPSQYGGNTLKIYKCCLRSVKSPRQSASRVQ